MSITLPNGPTVLKDEDLNDSWLQFDDIVIHRNTLEDKGSYNISKQREENSVNLFDDVLGHLLRGDNYHNQSTLMFTFTKESLLTNQIINLNACRRITGGLHT